MTILRSFLDWFWNPDVWLPPGIGWNDIKPTEKIKYCDYGDLLYPIPAALCLICVRFIVEKTILIPWGQCLGLKKSHKTFASLPHNEELENAYRKSRSKLSYKEMEVLAKKTDMEVRQIERWIRRRLAKDKHTTLTKFSECGWRWICYTASFGVGLYVMWDKPWFWDINHCWYDFPHHGVPDDVWWYYVFGAGFYLSLLITQAFDAKRKDFWQMFVHHLTTISLMGFSWVCNFIRIGTLILIIHDCADVFLEAAKMCKYAKYDKLGDVIFAVFTLLWIGTRLGVYPLYVLNSTLIEAPKIVPMFPAYYIFNSMLIILLVLHTFWTYYILKVAVKAIVSGKVIHLKQISLYNLKFFSKTKN
ncbi:unnamed protein product [Orchesella dallaii]|uniref:Ceramide synthase 6 n=1 Tax=Orchesella dallaii TaxID=48710 RepID=A0ABP1S996_9HEXA